MTEGMHYPDIDHLERTGDLMGLIKALEHEDYLTRKEAARSLKKVGDSRAVIPLIKSLRYEEWQRSNTLLSSLREYSAEALGIIGDKRAVNPLIQSIKEDTDDEVRWRAVYALGKIGDFQAVDNLIDVLQSSSWIVREQAAKALGRIGSPKAVDPLIIALEDAEWRVRKQSVIALGKIQDERSVQPLINHLSDEDEDVKRKTIDVLASMGNLAYKPLLKLFEGKNWYTRSKAAQVLGKIGNPRVVDVFIKTLSNKRKEDRNRYVRGRVAEALGNIGDPKAIDALISALDDQTLYVRQKAEEAIIKIRSLEYPGAFKEFSNGTISFNYPEDWKIKTVVPDEKFEASNPQESIKLSLYRKMDLEEISFDELIKIWDEIFEYQNIVTNTRYTTHMGDTQAFLLIGDNLNTDKVIMIVGFKLYDLFYYLHFTIDPKDIEYVQDEVDLIVNTFRIHISYI